MVMRHHQKYFAVETNPAVLAPHFVAVMNIPADPGSRSQKRQRTAGRKSPLQRREIFLGSRSKEEPWEDRVEDLSKVTFKAKLGTYLGKDEQSHSVSQMN